MYFAQPIFLWLMPVLVGFLALALRVNRRHRMRRLETFAGAGERPWAQPNVVDWRVRWDGILIPVIFGLFLIALAQPRIFRERDQGELQGTPYLIALDASRSMLAADLRPNRWTVATNLLDRFLDSSRFDRAGLITFSGVAYLNAPLSFDMTAVRTTLRYLHPGAMNDPGSSLASAIERAGRYFVSNQISPKILILISDGEDLDGDPARVARQWAREGLRIACIGVGTTTGATVPSSTPIAMPNPNAPATARNTFGQEVTSRLNEGNLQRIASAAEGRYYRLGERGEGLERMRTEFLAPFAEAVARADLHNYRDAYYLPLALALIGMFGRIIIGADRIIRPTPLRSTHSAPHSTSST